MGAMAWFCGAKSLSRLCLSWVIRYRFSSGRTSLNVRKVISPDQYEIVDVRTDRGMRRAMLFPKSNPKSRVGRRRAVARRADNQARAMAAIAVGEREEWAAPQRVKPVHSGVPYVQHSRIRFPPCGIHGNYVLP